MNIVLACGASAALHKACDLASQLAQKGHAVRTVLTPRAARLVHPQLFAALTGEAAESDEFGPERRTAMDHIDLARWAELFLVAPAPADLVARLALGLGDDLVTTTALALPTTLPRILCPAMNPNMWSAPPLRRNVATLIQDGWKILEPDSGHTACGVQGKGRMAEPAAILEAVARLGR